MFRGCARAVYRPLICAFTVIGVLSVGTLHTDAIGTIVDADIVTDETWTSNSSPYLVMNDIVVAENATLTIEEGVQVKFQSNASITVRGHIMVFGTPQNPVLLGISNQTNPPWIWDGIYIHSDGNQIRHAEIIAARGGISLNGTMNVIDSCIFTGLVGYRPAAGVSIFNATGPNLVINSHFTMLKPAVSLLNAVNAEISNNTFRITDPAIIISGNGSHYIHNNEFHSNIGMDITIFESSYNVMAGNLMEGSPIAINCYSCLDNYVVNCTIKSLSHDFRVDRGSSLTVINSSFGVSKVVVEDFASYVYVRNFLNVAVRDLIDFPVANANVTIVDDGLLSTRGATGLDGTLMWIQVPDISYQYNPIADFTQHDNITIVTVNYSNWNFDLNQNYPNPREVNMSNSHWETFYGAPPQLVKPDYVPIDSHPMTPITIGVSISLELTIRVKNVGNSTNATVTLSFYNSSTPSSPFSLFQVPSLFAGDSTNPFITTWTSPVTPDVYIVNSYVDCYDDVSEENESNNQFKWTINVVSGPITSLEIGSPNHTATMTYVTSSTPLAFSTLDQSGTGINHTWYTIDGGSWDDYSITGPFMLTGENEHLIEWFSIDNAGNVEDMNSISLRVDNSPPETLLMISNPKHLVNGTYVTSTTKLSLNATDSGQFPVGIKVIEYRLDGGSWIPYSNYFIIENEGRHTLEYTSRDMLDNVETAHLRSIVVDNSHPVTELIIGVPKYLNRNYFITSATPIVLNANDGGILPVGLSSTQYRIDNRTWMDFATPLTVEGGDGPHMIEYRSVDLLGNSESINNVTIIVDNTSPTTTLYPTTGRYNRNTVFLFSALDLGCGLNVTRYRIDDGGWMAYTNGFSLLEGSHNITYNSTDYLGNEEPERRLQVIIESQPPLPPLDVQFNIKPFVAYVFAIILFAYGVVRSTKSPCRLFTKHKTIKTLMVFSLPFALIEILTGIVSFQYGVLAIPPIFGWGTMIDLTILFCGLLLTSFVPFDSKTREKHS